MNYRHVFHAGNFADVLKHAVLARVLVHLRDKPQAFRVIDLHAGSGLYDLRGAEANRTGEWHDGIGRLSAATLPPPAAEIAKPYLDAIAQLNGGPELRRYPGSPRLALALMRPQDRLVACELEPRAAAALKRNLRSDKRAKAVAIDGWTALKAYLPPQERRGVVLIDPPFEDRDEFARLAEALESAHRKWPTGIYLAWYPVKDAAPDGLIRQLRRAGIAKMLRAELHVAEAHEKRLAAAGLLVVNPPWRLDDEIATLLPALTDALARADTSRYVLER